MLYSAVFHGTYVYDVDFMYRKRETCIIPTICLCSRFCVHERGKLYHTYSMFMIYIFCIRKRGTVSYLHCVYVVEFVFQKEGNCVVSTVCLWSRFNNRKWENCIIPTICLCSGFCVSERGNCAIPTICLCYRCCVSERRKLYHTYHMFMF